MLAAGTNPLNLPIFDQSTPRGLRRNLSLLSLFPFQFAVAAFRAALCHWWHRLRIIFSGIKRRFWKVLFRIRTICSSSSSSSSRSKPQLTNNLDLVTTRAKKKELAKNVNISWLSVFLALRLCWSRNVLVCVTIFRRLKNKKVLSSLKKIERNLSIVHSSNRFYFRRRWIS